MPADHDLHCLLLDLGYFSPRSQQCTVVLPDLDLHCFLAFIQFVVSIALD
jgi:hypothetical protein